MFPEGDSAVTRLLYVSHTFAVIAEVAVPFARILAGFAVFTSFAAVPAVVVTLTVLWLRLDAVVVTTAVPAVVLERRRMVAMPLDAFFVDVSSRVPSPETVNVTVFVAVVIRVLPELHTLLVTREVALPFAEMLRGDAVFIIFVGPSSVVTLIVPWVRPDDVVVTIAVPAVLWDRRRTVAMPLDAFFVDVSSRVPGPETVNVTAFVAVVTVALPLVETLDVTSDVAAPSAMMLVRFAVFMIFTGVVPPVIIVM